ncbi:MAG: DUF192 domain-containing protein [Candidatus Anammoxibacter sp.]
MKKGISLIPFILFCALCYIVTSCQKQVIHNDNISTINIAGIKTYVELAITDEEHRKGLMFRDKLKEDHGMLFIFPDEKHVSFWMKNTLIPLSIAFIKEDGWIAQIEDMQPNSLESHASEMKVKYILEMQQGWFKEKEIVVGDFLKIPLNVKMR